MKANVTKDDESGQTYSKVAFLFPKEVWHKCWVNRPVKEKTDKPTNFLSVPLWVLSNSLFTNIETSNTQRGPRFLLDN